MSKALITESNLTDIADAIRAKLGVETTYRPGDMAAAIGSIETPNLEALTVTQNGSYSPSTGKNGFSGATVNVPNSYAASDEGKVVSSGALVAQTARASEITSNGTYDTTINNSVTVNVSGGGGNVIQGTDIPTSNIGENGNYYYKGEYQESTLGFTGSFSSGNSGQTNAGWEFTANENISCVGLAGETRTRATGSLVLAANDGTILKQVDNVDFNYTAIVEFDNPVQLTSEKNYIVYIIVPTGPGIKYRQSSAPPVDSRITYVRGRYGALPGTAEANTLYSTNIIIEGDGLFRANKQYYKSNGMWIEL